MSQGLGQNRLVFAAVGVGELQRVVADVERLQRGQGAGDRGDSAPRRHERITEYELAQIDKPLLQPDAVAAREHVAVAEVAALHRLDLLHVLLPLKLSDNQSNHPALRQGMEIYVTR